LTKFDHLRGVPGSRDRLAAQVWEGARVEVGPAEVPELSDVHVPEELRATIEHHMSLYPDEHSAVLPALGAAQKVHGWLSEEAILQVASVMRVTPAYLESVASFYDMLETTPMGRHRVYVCTNISCSLCGADELFATMREAAVNDEDINVRGFECLGACDIAPMASVDGVYVGPLTLDDVPRLLDDVRSGRDVLPEKQLVRKAAADPRANRGRLARPADADATLASNADSASEQRGS
jgi:NADH-quinone oxidoreductase subunit E